MSVYDFHNYNTLSLTYGYVASEKDARDFV